MCASRSGRPGRILAALVLLLWASSLFASEAMRIAAASDLRFALDEIVALYRKEHPEANIEVVYGSSGKMATQILNGAPYDLFFSADIAYPEKLRDQGMTATPPTVYALGRIVIWSNSIDASRLTLDALASDTIHRIAIAQPGHAPYGARAREALQAAGVWDALQHKLVFGENIAHTAQMTQSGAAQVGIIALSLAQFPDLAKYGHHLIDDALHSPLTQGHVITRRGGDKPQARAFTAYMDSAKVHDIMSRYGFVRAE